MYKIQKVSICILACLLLMVMTQPLIAATGKVNINTASKKELLTLKYVGDKIADRIIEFRKAHAFTNPKDIIKVKGIGEKIYEANKDLIVVTE